MAWRFARIEAERRLFPVVGQFLGIFLFLKRAEPAVFIDPGRIERVSGESFYLTVDAGLVVVAHGHDGQHQVDEVEGAKEDDDHEEDDGV